MAVKLELIAAACENMGIGKNGSLPWRLKSEMNHFTTMTTLTTSPDKKNIVLMGRRTWDCIPSKYKPLSNRINVVLSRSNLNLNQYENCFAFKSLEEVVSELNTKDFQDKFERVWVIGGSDIYRLSLQSEYFHRLYLTKILKEYDCDTFFPEMDETKLKKITDPKVPEGIQEEKDVKFVYNVYENVK